MSDHQRLTAVKEKLKNAGNMFIVKPSETQGLYSVVDPGMPKKRMTAWENLSVEQLEDLAENLVAMWQENESEASANNKMAAEELAKLKREWDALSGEKRAKIAEACPWFGVYFGVIHRQ